MTRSRRVSRQAVIVLTLVVSTMFMVVAAGIAPLAAQDRFEGQLINGVTERGWWDESGELDSEAMQAVADRWGPDIAFAYSDRALDVQQDPALSAAALLAQSSLEQLQSSTETHTLIVVIGNDAGGATTAFPYPNVVMAVQEFDRNDVAASFDRVASTLVEFGDELRPIDVAQTGFFGSGLMFVLLGGVTGVLALASLRSSKKKSARRVHTSDARSRTALEIQEMSDLILDLEPRVTIADDPDLKERYTKASKTYSEVLEHASQVESGHEVADLRLEIAQARWKLDVIDAELEGRTPPPEPYSRDNTGSAWDSTRGTGAQGSIDQD